MTVMTIARSALARASVALFAVASLTGQAAKAAGPDYLADSFTMERVLDWGERPVWSPDGTKIAFTPHDTKDGPAYELDLRTKAVRCLTCRWGNNGLVTRIYYLPDGSFLILAGPKLESSTSEIGGGTGAGVASTELYWMPASLALPPQSLQAPAFGEIAIIRKPAEDGSVRIAFGVIGSEASIVTADLVHDGNRAALTNRRLFHPYRSGKPGAKAPFAETYDFADDGRAVTFWTIETGSRSSGMYKYEFATGALTTLPQDGAHNETHLFPDERYGLEESNRMSDPAGPVRGMSASGADTIAYVLTAAGAPDAQTVAQQNAGKKFDLFIRSYAGESRIRRLTEVSTIGGEAHQSSPSPDGRRIAFAMRAPASGPYAGKPGLYVGTFGPKPGPRQR